MDRTSAAVRGLATSLSIVGATGDLEALRQVYRRSRIEVPSKSPEVP
jgi:hypothetical protein